MELFNRLANERRPRQIVEAVEIAGDQVDRPRQPQLSHVLPEQRDAKAMQPPPRNREHRRRPIDAKQMLSGLGQEAEERARPARDVGGTLEADAVPFRPLLEGTAKDWRGEVTHDPVIDPGEIGIGRRRERRRNHGRATIARSPRRGATGLRIASSTARVIRTPLFSIPAGASTVPGLQP